MKPFDLSQYMLTLSQAAGADKVGYNAGNTYAAGTVGAALKTAGTTLAGLGTMSTVNDAPNDGFTYGRQNAGWTNTPYVKNGITIEGQATQQFAGMRIQSKYASASQNGQMFVDFSNELNTPLTAVVSTAYTDGAGSIDVMATKPGARNTDRRGIVSRFGTGDAFYYMQINPAGTIQALGQPDYISLGPTYADTAGVAWKGKLRLLEAGANIYSIGVSNASMDYMAGATGNHNWYSDGVWKMQVDANGVFSTASSYYCGGDIYKNVNNARLVITGSNSFNGTGGGAFVLRGNDSAYQPGCVEFYAGTGTTKYERGMFNAGGEFCLFGNANQILLKADKGGNNRTAIIRNDGSNFYVLLSDPATYPNGVWNTLRPFTINMANGDVSMSTTVRVNGGGGTASLYTSGDIRADRGNGTGLYGFADGTHYLYWDGANYHLAGANLYANGSLVMTDQLAMNVGGEKRFNAGGGIIWSNPWSALQVYNVDTSGGGSATMSFLRPAQYGIFYGLDPDNVVRLGGWSSGVRFTSDTAGNFVATGNVAAFSDERLKTNWRPVCHDFVKQLAAVHYSGVFDRIDTKETQVGVGAQSIQRFFPQAVRVGDHGTLTMNYGGAAMVSAVELAKKVVELEEKIARLERLIRQ